MRRAPLLAALVLLAAPARAGDPPLWAELPAARRAKAPPTLAELTERARPAVVHVRGVLPPQAQEASRGTMVSVGSGFFLDGAGHLVTNEHVVRGATDVRVRLYDGRELAACVLGADPLTDLALLKADAKRPVPSLPLGDSDAIRAGEVAVAIGSPFGFAHSVTAGIVSAKDRVVDRREARPELAARAEAEPYAFFIQTDAAINVGNSGGPLIDAWGAVVGVNAAFWGGGQSAQGVSFAIPINIAKRLLPRLRADGSAPRSLVGVDSQAVTAALAEALGLEAPRGALIASVASGSPAEAAGLEPGDVVLSWDGRSLSSDEDFKIYAQLTPPGTRVRLRVARAGHAGDRVLVTGRADEPRPPRHPASCAVPAAAADLDDGFDAEDVTGARARGLPGGRAVEVTHVRGGAARDAGLSPGDLVLRAGRGAVRSLEDLRRLLRDSAGGAPLPLLLRRDGADFWIALPRR